MLPNETNQCLNGDNNKNKESENFIIEPLCQNLQQSNLSIVEPKILNNQLNSTQHVQISSGASNSNIPFIIQNGNIYQIATSGTNQLNASNLIQISTDNQKSNPMKLTTLKNANILNLNTINKGRIILKSNQNDSVQGQQVITTISPNSLSNPKNSQQNQSKGLNLVLQNPSHPKQYIIANQQNKSQLTGQNGSPIIVLTPTNRTIGDQNVQFLIQQKSQNINLPTSNATSMVNIPGQNSIQHIKTNNFNQKIYLPQNGLNVIKKNLNENEVKSEDTKQTSQNLISLFNSNVNSTNIKQEPVVVNNQQKSIYQKAQKEIVSIAPTANKINNCQTTSTTSSSTNDAVQKEEINETILNECILPDTRIFASLLNKDHNLPNNNSSGQKNEIKYKTVLIGNTEHVILDNLQNLSDFKGNFSELKNLACSVADHLNKSVSIPAFLLIDSKSSIEKIKTLLGDININPIVIDTLSQNSQQNDTKSGIDQNTDREKFNQHHQNLIKKLNSNKIETVNNYSSPVQDSDANKQKKISTPKRRVAKPRKPQIIINSNGTQVNKSKLTINDLIQQNAMNQSLEAEKSSEPTAKKIRTINQLVKAEPKINQSPITIQSAQPIQQIPQLLKIPISQPVKNDETKIQPNNDWLDEQIQLANEFIDTLTKNDEKEKKTKSDSEEFVKNEPTLASNFVNDENILSSVNSSNLLSSDYNFEIDPFDTNLYFSSNLNDIEF